jgi:hypothetical protein
MIRLPVAALLCGACVYVAGPGDPAPPDQPGAPARAGAPALPQASRWDGQAYCRQPFSSKLGWLDPVGHLLGFTEPVEHLALLVHDIPASGVVVPSPTNPHANDEVDIDGDWNFQIALVPGQDVLLSQGNFDPDYSGSLGAEIDHEDLPAAMWPRTGDRVAIRGDWVVDCWKDIAQAEIHPAFAVVLDRGADQFINYVRRSGVFTDLIDGVRDQKIDPDKEMVFRLVPPGPASPGQSAAVLATVDRRASGLNLEEITTGTDAVTVRVQIAEAGQYYAHLQIGWR